MSFGLGLLAGYGNAQREVNVRTHEEGLAAEKEKNEHTANILHDFMLRPDITPEMGQAALDSLMQFSSTPGIPNAKDRSKAFEELTGAMTQKRTFVSPDVAAARSQGKQDQSEGAGMTAAAAGPVRGTGPVSFPSIPSFGAPGAAMSARGDTEAATPMPGGDTRSGFLSKEEQAVTAGHAAGAQFKAMSNSMYPGGGGAGVGTGMGDDGTQILMLPSPNGKGFSPHIMRRDTTPTEANYIDADGSQKHGFIGYNRHNPTQSTDGQGRPVKNILNLMTRDGWITMTGVGSDNTPIKTETTKSGAAAGGPVPQYVPNRFINVKGADNTVSTVPVSPATGKIAGPAAATGVVQTDQQLQAQSVRNASTVTNTDLKRRNFKSSIDPTYGPDLSTPAGQPIEMINHEPSLVGTKLYQTTKMPASVIQRASTANVTIQQGQRVLQQIEDPANAELFGKLAGRWNELQTEGPEMFGKKFFGPIGTNDPRLARLHSALKSISDLLVTVHGRRDSQSARNFEASMSTVNSAEALAAVVRQYTQEVTKEIAGEAGRTTVPVSPGRGPVPISPTSVTSPPARHRLTPAEAIKLIGGN